MPIFETQRVWRIEAFEADNRSWLFFFGRTGPPARLQCPPYICPETPAWSKTDRAADPYKPIPTNARTEIAKRGRNATPRSNALCGKELSRLRPRPNNLTCGPRVGFPTKGLSLSPNENPARISHGRGLGNPLI